jgi:hypothetical protein
MAGWPQRLESCGWLMAGEGEVWRPRRLIPNH